MDHWSRVCGWYSIEGIQAKKATGFELSVAQAALERTPLGVCPGREAPDINGLFISPFFLKV